MILGNRMLHFEIRNFRLKCKGSRDQTEIYLHEYPSFYLHGNDFETRNNFCLLTAHFASSNFCDLVILR